METYLIIYAIYFAIISIGLGRRNIQRWLIGATLPMLALVWLRGVVGVDTPMYMQSIEMITPSTNYKFIFEPGFEFIIIMLGNISSDALITTKIIATITTVFLLFNNWRTSTAYQVMGLGVIPYFYLDMTMNGLRYGLAFSIVLLSMKALVSDQRFRFTLSVLLASSMQISTIYLISSIQIFSKFNWKYLVLIIVALAIFEPFATEFLMPKVSVNATLSKPGITAGMAPLFLSLLVLSGCFNCRLFRQSYGKSLVVLFSLTFIAYGVTQISYAGLRIQQMNYFLILLFVIFASEKSFPKKSNLMLTTFIIVAALSSAFRFSNFQPRSDVGAAPFVPYKFYWTE